MCDTAVAFLIEFQKLEEETDKLPNKSALVAHMSAIISCIITAKTTNTAIKAVIHGLHRFHCCVRTTTAVLIPRGTSIAIL